MLAGRLGSTGVCKAANEVDMVRIILRDPVQRASVHPYHQAVAMLRPRAFEPGSSDPCVPPAKNSSLRKPYLSHLSSNPGLQREPT
ncbi:hypothetical protein LZ32DRAFT_612095 [Colletotrichum eremochloae]|nr:hypothetical protein LZ32DRAFT_612095 [Colletotrichum eremochloae]